jgi:urate oxidase
VFHNYMSNSIQTTMYHAFSAIFNIVAGITAHPLSQLLDKHMTNMLKEFEDAHQGMVMDEVLHDLAHNFLFPIPCLLGNMSLIEDFMADMDTQRRRKY